MGRSQKNRVIHPLSRWGGDEPKRNLPPAFHEKTSRNSSNDDYGIHESYDRNYWPPSVIAHAALLRFGAKSIDPSLIMIMSKQ